MSTTLRSIHRAAVAQCRLGTPLGDLLLAATEAGLAGAWFDGQRHHPGALSTVDDSAHAHLRHAADELGAYFHGQGPIVFTVPLDLHGTPFQRSVWLALCGIGASRTDSYGALAARLGTSSAVRAVAGAVARNPLSVVVPCHRVLGGGGALTGYAGGLDRKRALLQHEARWQDARAASGCGQFPQ